MELVNTISNLYAYLTVAGGIFVIVGIVALIVSKTKFKDSTHDLLQWIDKNSLLLIFIVSVLATLGSLFYSEVAGYEPCKLCWFQRIFMYPLALISGIALYFKDRAVKKYIMPMASIGLAIALYHYLLQIQKLIFPSFELPSNCGLVGYSAGCSNYFVLKLGYITIPMMAATAFAMIIVILIIQKKKSKIKEIFS